MKPRFLFLLLAIGAAGYVQAADTERKPEWKKALVLGEPSAKSQKVRKEIAQGLRAEINAMLAFLPNLRLAQNQWLASEREALNRLRGEAFVSKVRKFMSSLRVGLVTPRLTCG